MTRDEFLAEARSHGALVLSVPGADIAVWSRTKEADDLVLLPEAAELAKTSVRVVKDAIRSGELSAFGKQRDRTVRRSDVARWVEARRVRPVVGPIDADIQRRMRQIARGRGRA